MDDKSMRKFYTSDYRNIYAGYSSSPDRFLYEQIQRGTVVYDYTAAEVSATKPRTVFDIGCGAGGMLIPFVKAGWHAYGCDVGDVYLQHGRNAGLTLEHGSASVLQKRGPADLVILSHVLEHLPSPLEELRQISQLMTDDGYLYVELPGIFSIHKTYGDTLLFLQNAHLYHFTLATLTALLGKAGFRLIKGDESIRALFQKSTVIPSISTVHQYRRVKTYLILVELNRISLHYRGMRAFRHQLIHTFRRITGNGHVDGAGNRLGRPDA